MNDLDDVLRDWSVRQEPSPAAMQELHTRIGQQLANVDRMVARTDVGVCSTTRTSGGVAVIAVAVSLLAAVTLFWVSGARELARPVDVAHESTPSDLVSRQSLFNELDRMFDGHWRWLGEVNGRVHLQTEEPVTSAVDVSDNGVAVRLAVVQRRPGESKWHVVWEASVVARSDEWVRLPEELIGDDTVSVWAHSLPDGALLIESEVTLTAPVPVRLSEQQVFGGSVRPARLWSTRRADGEFQLIQSIARLETHHG